MNIIYINANCNTNTEGTMKGVVYMNNNHYGGVDNPHEPIKIIEYYDLNFNMGNVVKYILRAGIKYPSAKGKIEDLE